MKAEERKALQSNALAQELNKAVDVLKQGPSRSTMVYVGLTALIVLGVIVFRWFWVSSEAAASRRWVALDNIVFPEQLSAVLDESDMKGKLQGQLARFKEARLRLTLGIQDFAASPSMSRDSLAKGTALYVELIDEVSRIPLLHQEALWGAAKGYEAQGDIENAQKYYAKLVNEYPKSTMGKDAAKQQERLATPEGRAEVERLRKEFAPPSK